MSNVCAYPLGSHCAAQVRTLSSAACNAAVGLSLYEGLPPAGPYPDMRLRPIPKPCQGVSIDAIGVRLLMAIATESTGMDTQSQLTAEGCARGSELYRQLAEQLPAHALYHRHGPVAQEHG